MINGLKKAFKKVGRIAAPYIAAGIFAFAPGCGGGGGGGGTPPVNNAPTITSHIDSRVEDNIPTYSSNIVVDDVDGDDVTGSIIDAPSDAILTEPTENNFTLEFDVTPYQLGDVIPVTLEFADEHGLTIQEIRNIIVHSQGSGTNRISNENCILIADPALSTSLQELVDYTIRKGMSTKMYTTTYVYANSTGSTPQEQIRNFIKARKASHSELEHIVLAGDDAAVPAYRVQAENTMGANISDMPSDLPYSAINGPTNFDGDLNIFERVDDAPDLTLVLNVSRLPFATTPQVDNFINNLKTYDASLTKANDILFSAGYIPNPPNPPADAAEEKDSLTLCLGGKNVTKLYESLNYGGSALNKASLVAALNSGCNIWNHYAHGYLTATNCGGSDEFNLTDAQNLTTTNPFIAYLVACTTGNFADAGSDCLAESLLKNKSIGVIAPTDVALYSYPWVAGNGTSWNFDKTFFVKLYSDGITNFGEAFTKSKENYKSVSISQKDMNWIYKSLHLLGYSPMDIHTDNLGDLAITQDPRTDCIDLIVTDGTNPVADTSVCIVTPANEIYVGNTNAQGRAVFPITPSPTDKTTATMHNYKLKLIN